MKIAKTLMLAALLVPALPAYSHATDVCVRVYDKAEHEKTAFLSDASGLAVTGPGRLYFHMAPDERCRLKVFVIPNDRLEAYAQYGEFTDVIYWNPASGTGTAGWVATARLVKPAKVSGTTASRAY